MLKAEQIPEVVWRVAMMTYHREIRRNPEQAWQLAIAAALNAWPGMVHQPRAMLTKTWFDPGKIILPLPPQEGE
jgi:predicted RNA polymerase sigma factor